MAKRSVIDVELDQLKAEYDSKAMPRQWKLMERASGAQLQAAGLSLWKESIEEIVFIMDHMLMDMDMDDDPGVVSVSKRIGPIWMQIKQLLGAY